MQKDKYIIDTYVDKCRLINIVMDRLINGCMKGCFEGKKKNKCIDR